MVTVERAPMFVRISSGEAGSSPCRRRVGRFGEHRAAQQHRQRPRRYRRGSADRGGRTSRPDSCSRTGEPGRHDLRGVRRRCYWGRSQPRGAGPRRGRVCGAHRSTRPDRGSAATNSAAEVPAGQNQLASSHPARTARVRPSTRTYQLTRWGGCVCTRSRRSTPPGCGTARPRTAPAPARTPATSNRMRPMGRGWAAEVIAEQRQRLTWDMWSAERVTGAPARMRARGSHVDGCPVRRDNRCSVELGEDTWPPVVCRHGGSAGVDGEPRGTHSAPVPRRPTRPGRPGSPRPRGEPVAGTRGAGWGRRSVLDRCTRATRGAASTVRRQPDVPAAGRVAVPDPVDRSLYGATGRRVRRQSLNLVHRGVVAVHGVV